MNSGASECFFVVNHSNQYLSDICTEASDAEMVFEARNGGEIKMKNYPLSIFSEYADHHDLGHIEEEPIPAQTAASTQAQTSPEERLIQFNDLKAKCLKDEDDFSKKKTEILKNL
jgi:hypothetical protein